MSRFGWAFVNDVIIGTGSAGTGSAVDGPAHAVVVRDSGIVSGATNFIFNNSTGFGQLTGSLGITNNLSVTGNLNSGPFTTTTINATTNINSPSLTGSLRSDTGNKFGSVAGNIHQFTGSISAGIVSGTTAQFTTVSGSTLTGSSLLTNTATISNATISTITNNSITSNVLYVTGASNSIISGKNITGLANRETSGLVNGATTPSIANSTTFYIKPDGSKLYVHDTTDSEIVICTLSTPWDISTLTIDSTLITNKPVASAVATGFTFKPDGRNAYILTSGPTNQELFQANLSIPWDLNASTTWTSVKILTGSGGSITGQQGISISEDGRYLFTCSGSTTNSSILRYTMSTPWSGSTISHTSPISSSITLVGSGVKDIAVSNDGKSILILDNSNYLHDFELSTPYDLTLVTKKSSISLNPVTTPHSVVNAMFLKPDQTKIYFDSVNTTKHFISLTMSSSQVDLVGGIHITGDAKITQNINVYGDATFEDLSGSNAQFRTLSGSLVNLTNLTASVVDINGGTIDNTTIATSNITVGSTKTLDVSAGTFTTAVGQITNNQLATISTAGKVSNSATTANSANTANAIVARDASGNFVAGKIEVTTLTGSTGLSGSQGQFAQLTSSATLLIGATSVGGNIIPNAINAYDLGSVSNKWRNVFVSGAINTDSIAAGLLRSTGSNAYIVVGTGSNNTLVEVAHTGGNVYRGMRIMSGTTEKWFAGADTSDNLYVIRRNNSTNDLTISNTGLVTAGSITTTNRINALSSSANAGVGIVIGTNSDTGRNVMIATGQNNTYRGMSLYGTGNTEKWFVGADQSDNFVITKAGTSILTLDSSSQRIVSSWPITASNGLSASALILPPSSIPNAYLGNSSLTIGGTSISLGSTAASITGITTVDTTNLEVTNLKALDGTSAGSIANTTGIVTITKLTASSADINAGTIDNAAINSTTIGATGQSSGKFTSLSASSNLDVGGNLTVAGTINLGDTTTDQINVNGDLVVDDASTFTGLATFNGNVNIGNSSTDILTVESNTTFQAAVGFGNATVYSSAGTYIPLTSDTVIVFTVTGCTLTLISLTSCRFLIILFSGSTGSLTIEDGTSSGIVNTSGTTATSITLDTTNRTVTLIYNDNDNKYYVTSLV